MKKVLTFFLVSILFSYVYADEKSQLEQRKNQIDKQVQQKKTRIEKIDTEKKTIAAQIKDIEKEITDINNDRTEIMNEITVVSRNIEYGERSLNMTSSELTRKKSQYGVKVSAWNKYLKTKGNNPEDALVRKNFKNLMFGDLGRIEHIQTVQFDIKKVKTEIENDRKKLTSLRAKLDANKKDMDAKMGQKNRLIARLNKERTTHQTDIKKLQAEKRRIDRRIRSIIEQATKSSGIVPDHTTTVVPDAIRKIGGLSKPLSGPIVVSFGDRKGGVVASNGIEISSKMGAQVKAAASGKVVFAGKFQGLTNVVMISYGYNLVGVYGNLISCKVSKGQTVQRGQAIGTLGKSSDGEPNLYYEVRFNKNLVNPVQCFK